MSGATGTGPMRRPDPEPSPERENTDESLRSERENTDEALGADPSAAQRAADRVLHKARASADAVLTDARQEADRVPDPATQFDLEEERERADAAVRGERATSDRVLRKERDDREQQANVLGELLVHERAATDAYLLTERARSDEDVSNRDDFLGMVAHDVRNLLNLVALSLPLLPQGDPAADPFTAGTADRIRRYLARMNRLVGDLVDVTSIDAGKLAVHPMQQDATALLAEATEAFQPSALAKGVSLGFVRPAVPCLGLFDHERMLQVFANVFSNSIKFTAQGGSITATVEPVEGVLRFVVRDTGVGVPSAMLEAIFERFWQVGKSDRRGMGLGLYISKCIVEAHGGRIWAESVGSGTDLYMTVPQGPPAVQ
jgi:signal transduction histidine kinase